MANPRQKDFEASRFHLIVTELDLAITFCKIASTTESEERAQRNLENARQAHDAALRLMHGVSVTSDMSKQIDERLEQLRPLLQRSWSS